MRETFRGAGTEVMFQSLRTQCIGFYLSKHTKKCKFLNGKTTKNN